jgi:hypothetical protein
MSSINGIIKLPIKVASIPIPPDVPSHLLGDSYLTDMENCKFEDVDIQASQFGNLERCYGLQRSGNKAKCSSGRCYMLESTHGTIKLPQGRWPMAKLDFDTKLYFLGQNRCDVTKEQLEKEKAEEQTAEAAEEVN